MARILVVESERSVADSVEGCLEAHGYTVRIVNTGPAALRAIDRFQPDLIVLEIVSPVSARVDFCRLVRAKARIATPIIALTAPGEEMELADFTADDHVVKPCRPRELTARITALLYGARCQIPVSGETIDLQDIRINLRTRFIESPRGHVRLTVRKFDLLYFLATHLGQVFSREQLISHVWDRSFPGDTRTVTSHIRRLRAKIEPDASRPRHLKTIWGVGYTCVP